MTMYEPDPSDPQKIPVYIAQSNVARNHPEHYLEDLDAVRAYVTQVSAAEEITVRGPFRAWQHDGGADDLIVDRSGKDQDLVGWSVPHQVLGHDVRVLPWPRQASHMEEGELTVGAPSGEPLSHRLAVLHEVCHIGRYELKHGPEWAAAFLKMTNDWLPDLSKELKEAFDSQQVSYA